jgi:hypothetical protein
MEGVKTRKGGSRPDLVDLFSADIEAMGRGESTKEASKLKLDQIEWSRSSFVELQVTESRRHRRALRKSEDTVKRTLRFKRFRY